MNYDKMEYKCECCGKKFTEGALIPNQPEDKKIALCSDCYADIEVYAMIHEPITKWIKIIQKIRKENK